MFSEDEDNNERNNFSRELGLEPVTKSDIELIMSGVNMMMEKSIK